MPLYETFIYASIKYYAGLRDELGNKGTNIKRFWVIIKQLYGAKVKGSIPTLSVLSYNDT